MAAKHGWSIDGVKYLTETIRSKQKPDWMKIGTTIGKMTGEYRILNMATGIHGLEPFIFQGRSWTIGGIAFDGIMRTDHRSTVRATQYPVQTGVNFTEHAIVEPAELSIDIMMSDAAAEQANLDDGILESLLNAGARNIFGDKLGSIIGIAAGVYMKKSNPVTAILQADLDGVAGGQTIKKQNDSITVLGREIPLHTTGCFPGTIGKDNDKSGTESTEGDLNLDGSEGTRSIQAWQQLKAMQIERAPVDVVTRLQTYHNMIIEDLSAPDDFMTLNTLKCTVRLKQVLFANVAEVKTSARAATTTAPSNGGQQPVASKPNKTALKQVAEAAGMG
jgi:hypothetical protein